MKIIRRVTKGIKVPIGRHMVVTKINKDGVFVRNIGEQSQYWLAYSLDNFEVVSCKSCKVSKVEFEALKYAVIIHHELGINEKEWEAIVKNKPKIIKFWYPKRGCIYIWTNMVKKRVIAGKPYVCIEIKQRCYEKPDD